MSSNSRGFLWTLNQNVRSTKSLQKVLLHEGDSVRRQPTNRSVCLFSPHFLPQDFASTPKAPSRRTSSTNSRRSKSRICARLFAPLPVGSNSTLALKTSTPRQSKTGRSRGIEEISTIYVVIFSQLPSVNQVSRPKRLPDSWNMVHTSGKQYVVLNFLPITW